MEARDYDHALYDLEKRLDRLRALYEQYFRGYERTEPLIPRKEVERKLHTLRKEMPRNTALRFRFQQLAQRYTTLTTRWGRITRQIEEGTHPLVLERMKRRRRMVPERRDARERESDSQPPSYELALDEGMDLGELLSEEEMNAVAAAIDSPGPARGTMPPGPNVAAGHGLGAMQADEDDDDTAATGRHTAIEAPSRQAPPTTGQRPVVQGNFAKPKPAPTAPTSTATRSFGRPSNENGQTASGRGARPAGSPAARPAPSAAQASGARHAAPRNGNLDESRKRAIYDEFMRARAANNESPVRYETVAKRIDTMMPELRKKHGTGDIDFDVVVRNGRVGLKPRRS